MAGDRRRSCSSVTRRSVKAAIDRNGKDGLASTKSFSSAMSSIQDDQVTRTYIDLKAYFDALTVDDRHAGRLGRRSAVDARPAPSVGRRRRADRQRRPGRRRSSRRSPRGRRRPTTARARSPSTCRRTRSRCSTPTTTATLLKGQLDQLRNDPTLGAALKQADQAAATLGGLDHLIGWIGDVGVVVTADGGTPGGGLVIIPTDVDQATGVMTELAQPRRRSAAHRAGSPSRTSRTAAGRSRRSTPATSGRSSASSTRRARRRRCRSRATSRSRTPSRTAR